MCVCVCVCVYVRVWFGSITQKETFRLNRVVKTVSRIIGRDIPSLEIIYYILFYFIFYILS